MSAEVPLPDDDDLVDVAGAARMLGGMTEEWVREQARRGALPSVKLGHYRMFRKGALRREIRERETGGSVR
jgi:hypothetical protein